MGEWNHDCVLPLSDNLVRDSFSPESLMPDLHLGQSWSFDSYSPLALPNHPMDTLQGRSPTEHLFARVEDREQLPWNGQSEAMWVVVYRSETGDGPGSERKIRNRLWVHRDGTVVREDVYLGDNRLRFTRMSEQETAALLSEHGDFQRQ